MVARADDGGLRLLEVRHFTITRPRPGLTEVRRVVWPPAGPLTAAVADRSGRHHAVPRCFLGGRCERVPLSLRFGSEDIVLAR